MSQLLINKLPEDLHTIQLNADEQLLIMKSLNVRFIILVLFLRKDQEKIKRKILMTACMILTHSKFKFWNVIGILPETEGCLVNLIIHETARIPLTIFLII